MRGAQPGNNCANIIPSSLCLGRASAGWGVGGRCSVSFSFPLFFFAFPFILLSCEWILIVFLLFHWEILNRHVQSAVGRLFSLHIQCEPSLLLTASPRWPLTLPRSSSSFGPFFDEFAGALGLAEFYVCGLVSKCPLVSGGICLNTILKEEKLSPMSPPYLK